MTLPQGILDVGSVVLAVAVIVLVVLLSRRQSRQREKTLEGLGFHRWKDVDARFTEGVRSLVLHTHPERLEIQQAFWRTLTDMRLVLFDLVDKKRGGSNFRSSMMAIYKPGIDLPEFRLFPQNSEYDDGRQAGAIKNDIDRLMEFASSKFGQKQIEFADQPEIARRFSISAADEERVRWILTPERLHRLLSLPAGTVLQVGSEMILVGRLRPVAKNMTWEQALRERVDLANQAAQIILL